MGCLYLNPIRSPDTEGGILSRSAGHHPEEGVLGHGGVQGNGRFNLGHLATKDQGLVMVKMQLP